MSRLAGASMKKTYLLIIRIIRYALAASFVAIVVSDLAECRPIYRYWQVSPVPDPQCRQGFAQLLTAGACSVVTDAVLIVFPIPIVISTRIATHRKVLLVLLFCLGFGTIGITLYRLPATIQAHGEQVVRSMWVSIELLAATTVANLVALGSFLRDSGAKKNKFQQNYPSTDNAVSTAHRPAQQWPDDVSDDSWEERTASKSEGVIVKVPSRTESHDSLIEAGQRVNGDGGVVDMRLPTVPPPAAGRQRQ